MMHYDIHEDAARVEKARGTSFHDIMEIAMPLCMVMVFPMLGLLIH